jgi:uncharacterized protein (DUF2336 family)
MMVQKSVIDELEDAIANKEIGRRADSLRRVTDLFVSGPARYSDEQIELFDIVMILLAKEIETSARATFGHRLATLPSAPPKIIRALALDDAIEVAGPILTHSEQLDEATLIESARTKSQNHLLAISRRTSLAEALTDVLVERGNQEVAHSTAENPGAKFSEFGYTKLVERSEEDAELAVRVWCRPEIPRQNLLKLFADASEAVRLKLEATDRRKAGLLRAMVAQASQQFQTETRERSAAFAAAHSHVQSLHEAGALTAAELESFARDGKFDETTIALSMMCDLSIGLVERAMIEERAEQILVLAKAIGLSWDTTRALLLTQAETKGSSTYELEQCRLKFAKLKVETAKMATQFYRLRERAAAPASDQPATTPAAALPL